MVTDSSSIDAFLSDGPNGVTFVLTSSTPDELERAVTARLRTMSPGLQESWVPSLFFSNTTGGLAAVLSQWPTPRNMVSIGSGPMALNASRLDCQYIFCPWPSEETELEIADGGTGCDGISRNLTGVDHALVRLNSAASNCTVQDAAAGALKAGAKGVVIAQRPDEVLVPLGTVNPNPTALAHR